jgi:hypothetical protein
MKALSGPVHVSIMQIVDMLSKERWPPATMTSTQVELEVHHDNRRHVMVSLDYAGELFRRAFVEERTDTEEVRELLAHIDRAAAVIVLVDPAVIVGKDVNAIADDDFGIVQAAQRIRRWPGGGNVPVVLVLAKYDQNKGLLDQYPSMKDFVARHFPALHRSLGRIPIFAVSAVQAYRAANGQILPHKESVPVNVEEPLLYCLKMIDEVEARAEADLRARAEQEQFAKMLNAMEKQNRRQQLTFAAVIATMIFVAVCIVVLLVVFKA